MTSPLTAALGLDADRAWMASALCATVGPTFTDLDIHDQLTVCRGTDDTPPCPVTTECAAYCLATHGREELRHCNGIAYGGLTSDVLRRAKRSSRKEKAA